MKSIFNSTVTLDEATHSYTVEGNEHLRFTSVTTWIGSFFPKFDARASAEAISKNPRVKKAAYRGKTTEEILSLWDTISFLGTETHKQIETWILERELPTQDKAYHGYLWLLNNANDPNIRLYPEVRVYSEKYQLAGTIDLLIHKVDEDRWVIVDWKTNGEISDKGYDRGLTKSTCNLTNSKQVIYGLQLSAYRYILETEYGINPENLLLIHLLPTVSAENPSGTVTYTMEYLKHTIIDMLSERMAQKEAGNLFLFEDEVSE